MDKWTTVPTSLLSGREKMFALFVSIPILQLHLKNKFVSLELKAGCPNGFQKAGDRCFNVKSCPCSLTFQLQLVEENNVFDLEKKPLYPRTSKPGCHCQMTQPGWLYSTSTRLVTPQGAAHTSGLLQGRDTLHSRRAGVKWTKSLAEGPNNLLCQPLHPEQRLDTPGRAPLSSPCSAAPTGL